MVAGSESTPPRRGINEATRKRLIGLASASRTRIVGRPPEHPSRWQPSRVRNPDALDLPFVDNSAWHFIVERLEQGEPVETIDLDKPDGATGYVMLAELREQTELLYIKLELAGNRVIGRSFHLSVHTQGNEHR